MGFFFHAGASIKSRNRHDLIKSLVVASSFFYVLKAGKILESTYKQDNQQILSGFAKERGNNEIRWVRLIS